MAPSNTQNALCPKIVHKRRVPSSVTFQEASIKAFQVLFSCPSVEKFPCVLPSYTASFSLAILTSDEREAE